MTVSELFHCIQKRLEAGGCDSPAFDACCLLEDVGGVGRGAVALRGSTVLSDDTCERVLNAADRRAAGEPLQYLLGTWDFLSLTLAVGEGVLIPRPETELLCEIAAEHLQGIARPRVLDLCAGSGCVGLGIASLRPVVTVTAVEKSPQAISYLEKNIARYPQFDVTAVCADALTDYVAFSEPFDAIVSNPPYIPTADLPELQCEVQHEPAMALDGGEDGLCFYRVIAEEWVQRLRPGGFVAVEVGIDQAADVACLFAQAGLTDVCCSEDFAGIPRVVFARRA